MNYIITLHNYIKRCKQLKFIKYTKDECCLINIILSKHFFVKKVRLFVTCANSGR